MTSPSKVCYMPLSTLSKRDRNLHECSSTQTAPFDELLRRCNFNWAEDAEEEARANGNLPMAAAPKPLDCSLPKAKWYNEPFPTRNYVPAPRFKSSVSTINEEIWDELWGCADGSTDATSSFDELQTDSDESNSTASSYEVALPKDEFRREHLTPNAESETYSVAQQDVDIIFSDRQAWVEVDEEIHHFNWLGVRVYTHCATSPSDSLAIILANPKSPQGGASLRIQLLLSRAAQYIDPVLVLLDDTDDSLFDLRGSELVRASTGRAFKFYSPHGRWLEDPKDTSEETTTDFGNVRTYDASDVAIGNGFVESSAIRSVSQWSEARYEACDDSGEGLHPRRMTWERKPSPLSQCESILPEITPESPQPETINQAKKPPRKITTCVISAPPEEYFSFPTPVFRPRGVRRALAKARRGLGSMLTSLKRKLR
ncbi:hypothetical protein N7517_010972 [Penicillium concentricum]|uniref:Uncharacterized protein n=1 Tax=Penicillium concentricum TaxID=293559 RepID=A0A9W9USX9_9EURO|nr:uncharacterized protein N7517_010972 [Penicillium concentricum]KAJ5356363.1 hypothetical protein N7517_010972 [Penicillium concentricum]